MTVLDIWRWHYLRTYRQTYIEQHTLMSSQSKVQNGNKTLRLVLSLQCQTRDVGTDAMWPHLAEFRHFGQILKVFANFSVFVVQILYPIGQNFIDVNGQNLKNSLAIWSHCADGKRNTLKGEKWKNCTREPKTEIVAVLALDN